MSIHAKIDAIVDGNNIVLFMKGTPDFPQCGFSGKVVQLLNHYGADFIGVNVLADPEMREGIKVYSDWPTIPQLYVRGEFVGGCDIVTDLHESGDLEELLSA